jgi:hypothetical protein
MVAIFSKPLVDQVATCYQVAHRFRPDCNQAALSILYPSFRNSLKVYTFVFIVTHRAKQSIFFLY